MNNSVIDDRLLSDIIRDYHHAELDYIKKFHAQTNSNIIKNYLYEAFLKKYSRVLDVITTIVKNNQYDYSFDDNDNLHKIFLIRVKFKNEKNCQECSWLLRQLGYITEQSILSLNLTHNVPIFVLTVFLKIE